MIIYYHCTRQCLVTIIFTNLPSLLPLSFHEMIFILVIICFDKTSVVFVLSKYVFPSYAECV